MSDVDVDGTPFLQVDPLRLEYDGITSIYVRARHGEKWVDVDLACLKRESLLAWLGGLGAGVAKLSQLEQATQRANRCCNVVLIMLGHPCD